MNRRFFTTALAFAVIVGSIVLSSAAFAKVYRVGVTPGTHERVMDFVKPLLAQAGIEIQVVSFSNYGMPNQAVSDGELDMNAFQHRPFLDNQVWDYGYDLAAVGTNFIEPMGFRFLTW